MAYKRLKRNPYFIHENLSFIMAIMPAASKGTSICTENRRQTSEVSTPKTDQEGADGTNCDQGDWKQTTDRETSTSLDYIPPYNCQVFAFSP